MRSTTPSRTDATAWLSDRRTGRPTRRRSANARAWSVGLGHPAPGGRDAGPGARDLRHAVLPAGLARTTHHQEVAGRGREIDRTASPRLVALLRAEEERAARAEGD